MRWPGVAEGSQMERRLRERRRLREDMLLDLGALVYELHRQGKRAPELLQEKAAELSAIDDEVRALEHALGGEPEREPDPDPEQPTEDVEPVDDYVVTRLESEDEDEDDPLAEPEPALADGQEERS
jgi:hypothetical protein